MSTTIRSGRCLLLVVIGLGIFSLAAQSGTVIRNPTPGPIREHPPIVSPDHANDAVFSPADNLKSRFHRRSKLKSLPAIGVLKPRSGQVGNTQDDELVHRPIGHPPSFYRDLRPLSEPDT
jgi:hypothetical protein